MLVQVVCLVAPCDWSHKSYDTECSKCRKVYYCSAVCQKQAFILRMGCRLSLKESSVSIFRTSLLTQNVFFSESPVCIQACIRDGLHSMASFRCNVFDAMDYNELPVISAFRRILVQRSPPLAPISVVGMR